MKTVAIYDEKEEKIVSSNFIEIDLIDLSSYEQHFHIKECMKIPCSVVRNKTILDWFTVNNISCWWFVSPYIYRRFDTAAVFVDQLLSFLEKNSPDLIKLFGAYDKLDIIQQICDMKKIQLEVSPQKSSLLSKIPSPMKKIAKKFLNKQTTENPIEKRLNIFTKTKTFKPPSSDYVLICSNGVYRRTVIDKNNETKREEFILEPILEKLKQNGTTTICFDTSNTLNTLVLEERLHTQYNWIPIELFLKEQKSESTKKSIHSLSESVNILIKTNFENIFDYRGVSLANYMTPFFKDMFSENRLPTYLHLLDRLEEFFKNFPPKVLVEIYEYGAIEKAILMAAKKADSSSYAIQHGRIHDHHPDYMHKEIQSESNPSGNPIPDQTLVFGKFYKKVLTKSGKYPEDRVKIIGNPTFYNIDKIKKQLSRQEILKKYDLPDKKIILIPAGHHFARLSTDPERIILNTLEKKLIENENLIGLVRPHPVRPFDQSRLDELYPSKIFKCSNGGLLEDIFISDLLITPSSTVAIDAALFQKPIIFTNLVNDNFGNDYQKFMIEKNIAISCSRDKIVSTTESILKGDTKVEMNKNREEFFREFFDDGDSTKLMNLIDRWSQFST